MKLYCRETGAGQPMVLLHGNGEDSSYFEHQVALFSKRYHIIAVDTRGHGRSPRGEGPFTLLRFANDLKELLDQKGLKKIILLGFSDGGNTAILFSIKYPQYVERLILNGANLNPFGLKLSVQLSTLAGYTCVSLLHSLSGLVPGPVQNARPDLKKKQELLGLMVKEPHIPPHALQNLGMPTLIIAGTRDMVRASHTKAIAHALPRGELRFIKGSHFIACENPNAFNRAVEIFLKRSDENASSDTVSRMKRIWGKRVPGRLDWKPGMDFSVLLPLVEQDGEYQVLFEVRSAKLKSQPGEVCFPGGAVEAGETKREAAVREAMEELLINREQIEILAPLDVLITPAGQMVRPFLAIINGYQGTFSEAEVEHIFTVPLRWFTEHAPKEYVTQVLTVPGEDFPFELVPGGWGYQWRKGQYRVLFYENENAVIWGMTAKILHSFVQMYQEMFSK